MTTNKRNVDRMVEVIDNASRHARMLYYLYLGFIAYCAVTVFSTTDRLLAIKGDTAQLPILDISVPLDGFFLVAPILAIGLFVYFMLYLHRLNSLVDDLFEVDPSYNKKDLYPWMINIAREPEKGAIGSLQKLFFGLTLWFTLPITLFIFASKFIKKHEEFLSFLIVAIAFFSIFIVFWFWNKINGDKYNKEIIDKFLGVVIGLIWVSFIFVIVVNEGYFKWANLDLKNELLVTIPDENKVFEGVYWADLEGVNWNGADLISAVLKRANLKYAKLNKSRLFQANLQGANLFRANLQGADLINANLLGVKYLKKEQVCKAGTIWGTKIDEDLLLEINSDKECAYKRTEKHWSEWRENYWLKLEQEEAEEGNLSVQGKLIKMQEEILEIQKTLIEQSNEPESSESK